LDDFPHGWQHNGRTVTFTWVGDKDVRVTRVYALAFTPDGKLLLVGGGPGGPDYWLPGGGIEDGETPESALIRELFEEAAATVHEAERLMVAPQDFLDTLFWGREDPKAAMLLERVLQLERRHGGSHNR